MRPASVVLVLLLLIALISCDDKKSKGAKRKEREIEVKTMPLKPIRWTRSVSVKGYTEAVHRVAVRPEISGKVVEVLKEEGEGVKRGELLVKIDQRDIKIKLRELKHKRESLRFKLSALEKAYQRRKRLYERELISREEFERFEADYKSLREELASLEARISALKRELDKTSVSSPIDGYVLSKKVEVGEVVNPQRELFALVKLSPLWFTFRVPYETLRYLQKGKEVKLSLPDRELKAKVEHVLPAADRDKLFTVRLRLENRGGEIKPMTYGVVHIPQGEIRAFRVPEQAVQVSERRSFLWKVENSRVKSVEVKVLGHAEGSVFVSGNLKEGDRVVVEGLMFLYEGAKVVQR